MINIVGFASLPPIARVDAYRVEPVEDRYIVVRWDGLVASFQPHGALEWHPRAQELGNYELAYQVDAGLMYRSVPGVSWLLAAEFM